MDACVLPDWVSNCGTAQLFTLSLMQPWDINADPGCARRILEMIGTNISNFIHQAFRVSGCQKSLIMMGCERLSRNRLALALSNSAEFDVTDESVPLDLSVSSNPRSAGDYT